MIKKPNLTYPTVSQFVRVLVALEREQHEEMQKLMPNVDPLVFAEGTLRSPGVAHVFLGAGGAPYCIGGFQLTSNGVATSWMFSTPERSEHMLEITRVSRRTIAHLFRNGIHRVQTFKLASYTRAHEWYRTLGLREETRFRKFTPDGEDLIVFARLREGF